MKSSPDTQEYQTYPNRYVDALENTDNYFIPVWQELAAWIRDKEVADVGCGSGQFTAYLRAKMGCRLVGVDGSAYALDKARANGFSEVYRVKDFNVETLPLESEKYDLVVNKDVLEHLVSPLHLLKEMNRILKPDGRLLLHVPNHFPVIGRIRFLLNNNMDPFGFCLGTESWESPHLRFFSFEDITAMLFICGFKMQSNLSYHFPAIPGMRFLPGKIRPRIMRYLTLKYASHFCCGFTVLAGKQGPPESAEGVQ